MVHPLSRQRRRLASSLVAGALIALVVCSGAASADPPAGGIGEITVVSNRADLISGGDALVSVDLRANARAVKVELNGTNITSAFSLRPNGRFEGLVTSLDEGENLLRVRPGNGVGRSIEIQNHPIGGPVFSGPQVQPWLCRTHLQNPALGPATDGKCNAPTIVERLYRNAAGQFVPYNPASPPAPADVQPTTTDQGKTVPFIVERVTGTANRGIYQFALLVDPTKPVSPWTEQPWNHKYVNTFGGACGVNYQQPTVGNVLSGQNVSLLGRGFAVGTSSLNTYGNQCNDIISAEALMMTKEILTERHGRIRYTIGTGGSAGTMQQHLITEAYPGLLDGITTSLLYEDHWYQVVGSFDCILLWRYFGLPNGLLGLPNNPNPLFLTPAERQKVWGSNPAGPGRHVRDEDQLHGGRAHRGLAVRLLRPTRASALALECRHESERHPVHDPGLPEGAVRGRSGREGAEPDRQRRRAIRAQRAPSRNADTRSSSSTSTPVSAGSISTASGSPSEPRGTSAPWRSSTAAAGSSAGGAPQALPRSK